MKPTRENIRIALDGSLRNSQKTEALTTEHAEESEDTQARFFQLTRNLQEVARPLDDGLPPMKSVGTPANYKTEDIKITDTPEGELFLNLFLYAPVDIRYGRSIYAAWHLRRDGQSRIVLEEYLSDKSFKPGVAAYRPDAPRLLSLLEESVSVYRETALNAG